MPPFRSEKAWHAWMKLQAAKLLAGPRLREGLQCMGSDRVPQLSGSNLPVTTGRYYLLT
jgi:hypothetical protein